MTESDQWSWWRRACTGAIGAIRENTPEAGFYRAKTGATDRHGQQRFFPIAFWYDKDTGALRCLSDGQEIRDHHAQQNLWIRCAKSPITKAAYDHKRKVGSWPDEVVIEPSATSDGVTRSNISSDPFQAMEQEIMDLVEQSERWLATTVVDEQAKADKARNWQNMLKQAWTRAYNMRDAEKRPHDEKAAAVQAKFRPLLDHADRAAKALKTAYERFMIAEDERLKRAAQIKYEAERAAAETERKRIAAERAKLMEDDPIAALTSPEPEMPEIPSEPEETKVRVGGGSGRRAGLRSEWVPTIVDYDKAAAHFIHHSAVRVVVEKLVAAETKLHKNDTKIPGVAVREEKRAV